MWGVEKWYIKKDNPTMLRMEIEKQSDNDLDSIEVKISTAMSELRKLRCIRRDLQLAYVKRNIEYILDDVSEVDAKQLFAIVRKIEDRNNRNRE